MNYHIRLKAILIIMGLYCGQQQAANRAAGCVTAPVCTIPVMQTTKTVTTEPTRQTEDDKTKAAILSHVAQIVNSISMIAANSKDRSNVGMQVGNVFGNVLGIVMVAGKKNGQSMDMQTAEQYLKTMDEQTKMKIAALFSTEMTRSMRDKGVRI